MSKERATMRPITLRRVIEICRLSVQEGKISEQRVTDVLGTTKNRAREILLEAQRMNLLEKTDGDLLPRKNARTLLKAFEQEQWDRFHAHLVQNYEYLKWFEELLSSHIQQRRGLTFQGMVTEAQARELPLNRTSVEVLSNWLERLGIIQRHLYARRIYMLRDRSVPMNEFTAAIEECYRTLNVRRGFGMRLVYIEIPRLREEVCEALKMPRQRFDEHFHRLYKEFAGKVELSGAPTVTAAKRSPLSIRTIGVSRREDILAPRMDRSRERKGIEIRGKAYYYVAIHDKLK